MTQMECKEIDRQVRKKTGEGRKGSQWSVEIQNGRGDEARQGNEREETRKKKRQKGKMRTIQQGREKETYRRENKDRK